MRAIAGIKIHEIWNLCRQLCCPLWFHIFGGKVKILVSGGAALNPEIGIFFNKLNLTLLQGYGQTEASPLISCNRKLSNKPKTVGLPVRDVKVKISNEGEILVKGKNLMQGYWKKR